MNLAGLAGLEGVVKKNKKSEGKDNAWLPRIV